MIVVDAMFYLMRDSLLSTKVKGVRLPNVEELLSIQFADDTTIMVGLEENNFDALMVKLVIFCMASGSKVSLPKSTLLGWDPHLPIWFNRFHYCGEVSVIKLDTWASPLPSALTSRRCASGLRPRLIRS